MEGIFISYRRDDSAGYAGRLYDRLAAHFGGERVFMDVEGIEPGTDFVQAIEKAVASCRVLIVLIGNDWVGAADDTGGRRLDDPNDFIRIETATALQRDIRVVPVLVDRAPMPTADELPDDLRALVRRQAVELYHKQWDATSGELIQTLEKILGDPSVATPGAGGGLQPPDGGAKRWWLAAAAALLIAGTALWWFTTPLPEPSESQQTGAGQPSAERDASAVADQPQTGTYPQPELAVEADQQAGAPEPVPAATATTETATSPPVTPSPPTAEPAYLVAQPALVDFAPGQVGERRVEEIRIKNTGGAPASLQAAIAEDARQSFRIIVDSCGSELRAGGECGYSVAFQSADSGDHHARLLVRYDEERQTLSVPLTGSAQAPPPEPPRIDELTSTPKVGSAQICYRVAGAERLSLLPQPGQLQNAQADCVTIELEKSQRFTLRAMGSGGSSEQPVTAAPLPKEEAKAPTPARPVITRLESRLEGAALSLCYRVTGADRITLSPMPGRLQQWQGCVKLAITAPTRFTLQAVNAGGKVRKSLLVDPPAQEPPGMLPRPGESWIYKVRGKWPASPKRQIRMQVDSASTQQIVESLHQIKPEQRRLGSRASGAHPGFVSWPGIGFEFSPWLGSHLEVGGQQSWSDIPTPDLEEWSDWRSRAERVGRERIQVDAGSFDSWKVEAWSNRTATGGPTLAGSEPVRMQFLVWYAPEVKRYVKSIRRIYSAEGRVIEEDRFELVSHGAP